MHGHAELEASQRARVARWLTAIVVPLALATLIGLVVFWPKDSPAGSIPLTSEGVSVESGEIASIGQMDEYGSTPVTMIVTSQPDEIEVPVHVPSEIIDNGMKVGDKVRVMFTPAAVETGTPYVFWDYERSTPLIVLAGLYVLVVALVAKGKGLAAVLGLFLSLAVVVFFMLPALLAGSSPFWVVLIGAGAMMFASIYFAHGISVRTTTAVLGTFGGLVVTAALAMIATDQANLSGTLSEGAMSLATSGVRLDQILACGMILAGLGALNDVTITQVSAVWELRNANPNASTAQLYKQGMIVGRDHIASTVYTLAFAYVGTALPLLMAAALMDRGFFDTLTAGEIAEEIVRTLVASVGLVLAIPLTTGIAARLARV